MSRKNKRPSDTAFLQQRLRAWRPVMTPQFVIPAFFILGILLIPIGIALLISSNNTDEIILDYSSCQSLATLNLTDNALPEGSEISRWSFDAAMQKCTLEFKVAKTIEGPVYLYYQLENYYQNYRKYVSSYNARQLEGEDMTWDLLGSCYPLIGPSDQDAFVENQRLVYYPCGSKADSMFLDDIDMDLFDTTNNHSGLHFSSKKIAWGSDSSNYKLPIYNISNLRLPPTWQAKYKTKHYNRSLISELVVDNQQFHVWMRTAPFPNFRKLHGRNDLASLLPGTYTISILTYTDVIPIHARKSIVIANTSWQGGKNNTLGITYLVCGTVILITGFLFLVWHLASPRDVGDYNYLSWNLERPKDHPLNQNRALRFLSKSG